ncbi:MAG TPA: amino acid ABC transporter permease [Acholeplasmataceae bacterium]|nr:amino acid ABC transporter permease [Acholeplasmataceae bacterium]
MNEYLDVILYLGKGALVSLQLFSVTILFSFPLAIILMFLYKNNRFLNKIIRFYTWLFRGTPLMLQLFFFMFGLPVFNIRLDRMMVAYVGFILNYAAYFVEIIRAGIESLPHDQEESGQVEGASQFQVFRYILLPQAIRKEIPTITNEVITLIKDTALVTVIALSELLRNMKEVVSRDFTIYPFFFAALFYLFFSYIIIRVFRFIEKKYISPQIA